MSSPAPWRPESWRERPALQQPSYSDPALVSVILDRIRALPPLVFSGEIEALRLRLADAAEGKAFVLHGGDCAERFAQCDRDTIVRKLKILLQMSLVLTHALRRPVVRVGRLAGQFAKPRSSDLETIDGISLPSYRGDLINDLPFEEASRRPEPGRMLSAYFHAASTINFVRALLDGGFADLHHPDHWQLEFLGDTPARARYQALADRIVDSIEFVESLGGVRHDILGRVEFWTSHEGLHLPYEEAFTVQPPRRDRHYDLSAHMLWIGDRTRALDGAHVEFFRGVANPIGVKIGPSCTPDELKRLVECLDPEARPGRLTLITRYGRERIGAHLPAHVRAVQELGRRPVWSCDPMHGNGAVTGSGLKTRSFDAILDELAQAFEIHAAEGSVLGGVHFELTGDAVTECVGGAAGPSEAELGQSYETGCDPRLNYQQSLEMAFLVADRIQQLAARRA